MLTINKTSKFKRFDEISIGTLISQNDNYFIKVPDSKENKFGDKYNAICIAGEFFDSIFIFNDDDMVIPYPQAEINLNN